MRAFEEESGTEELIQIRKVLEEMTKWFDKRIECCLVKTIEQQRYYLKRYIFVVIWFGYLCFLSSIVVLLGTPDNLLLIQSSLDSPSQVIEPHVLVKGKQSFSIHGSHS
jgi:hypothetical protein